MRDSINWARLLAFVTGLVNQELLLQNEYLAAENRILRAHLQSRLQLSDPERCTLAEIGKRLGRKRLQQVACTAKPDTILAWYRRLIARKFDGSRCRAYPGRPRVESALEELVVRFPARVLASETGCHDRNDAPIRRVAAATPAPCGAPSGGGCLPP